MTRRTGRDQTHNRARASDLSPVRGGRDRPTPLAVKLSSTAAALLPRSDRPRYAEEYRSELAGLADAGTGRWRQLRYSARLLARTVSLRLTLRYMDHPDLTGARRAVKNLFDRLIATAAVLLLSPLLIVIAVAVRLGDGGPVFFRQVRMGRNGCPFHVWKFRTMVMDAEERLAELQELNECGDGVRFKINGDGDPRITKVGSLLRRYSLDELPHLFNVLFGQMSLVGPRATLPEEAAWYRDAAKYGDYVRMRRVVRPGVTGLWQVSGRANPTWEEAVGLDMRYVENWSFALDLQILWKTCYALITEEETWQRYASR